MRLNIFRRNKAEPEAPPVKVAPTQSLIEQVYDAPATFNRATRRAVGLLSKVWRWASPAEMGNAEQAPRYIRRHYDRVLSHIESRPPEPQMHWPRGVRKERARIARIIRAKGIAS